MAEPDWTIASLKEHYDQRFDDTQKAVDAALAANEKQTASALAASEKAGQKAEVAAERRFDALNELRQMVNDQMVDYAKQPVVDAMFKGVNEKIEALQAAKSEATGRTLGVGAVVGYVFGIFGVIGVLVAIIVWLGG